MSIDALLLDLLSQASPELAGPGQFLIFGADILAERLRNLGFTARLLDNDHQTEQMLHGNIQDAPFLVAVIPADFPPSEQHKHMLVSACRSVRGILIAVNTLPSSPSNSRDDWEHIITESGYRRHPAYFRYVDYNNIGLSERGTFQLFPFEPAVNAGSSPKDENFDTGTDMTAKARSAAFRYHLAATFCRPGDVVLDCASTGYGTWMLRRTAPCQHITAIMSSDISCLAAEKAFPDQGLVFTTSNTLLVGHNTESTIDMIIALQWGSSNGDRKTVSDMFKALTPGGRIVVAIPLDQETESNEPTRSAKENPSLSAIAEQFLIERTFVQDPTFPDGQARYGCIETTNGDATTGRWLIVVAMKSPEQKTLGDPLNLTAFGRDYDNAWLMRSMFGISARFSNHGGLKRIAASVMTHARRGSPDESAAACVMGYAALERGTADERRMAVRSLQAVESRADDSSHSLRWKISNSYLRGRLHQIAGEETEAKAAYLSCLSYDWSSFSPTIGTKTFDAAFRAGLITWDSSDHEGAREIWRRGFRDIRRILKAPLSELAGTPDNPHPDALLEIISALQAAQHCVNALRVTDAKSSRSISATWPWLVARKDQVSQAVIRDLILQIRFMENTPVTQTPERIPSSPIKRSASKLAKMIAKFAAS
jgi:hypothetical protein